MKSTEIRELKDKEFESLLESYEKDKLLRTLRNTPVIIFMSSTLLPNWGKKTWRQTIQIMVGLLEKNERKQRARGAICFWKEIDNWNSLEKSIAKLRINNSSLKLNSIHYDIIIDPHIKKNQLKSLDSFIKILHNRFQALGYFNLDSGLKTHLHSLKMLGVTF